jgi:pSer/pThr/pTyr-binding forkhead associated (FHA) protein
MADQGTRLETEDDVRRVLQMLRPGAPGRLPAVAAPIATAPTVTASPAAADCPPLFRPTLRPPTPILTVCDDGEEDGESIRIRKDCFAIGRTEGDLVLPNDAQISGRHAELRQALVRGKYRWSLNDLQSTNGTYVRVGQAILEHGQEFIIGCTRFRFEKQAATDSAGPKASSAAEQATRFWQAPAASGGQCAAIVELTDAGQGARFLLEGPENWVGKDTARCQIVMSKDPLVSPRHARIHRQDDGRWVVENNKSINGVWLRVEQISFKGTCRFMLGEQKFIIQTPQ